MTTRPLAALAVFLTATTAVGQGSLEAGILTCELTDKTNAVIVSNATYACTFDAAGAASDEQYTATIGKLGVDLSIKTAEVLAWAVLSANANTKPGLIDGEYVGVSADAALGLGAGARVHVGGVDDSITLQPLSLSGSTGVGVAAGIERLSLDFEGAVN